jgi:hypothetical protein
MEQPSRRSLVSSVPGSWPVVLFDRIDYTDDDAVLYGRQTDGASVAIRVTQTDFERMVHWRQVNRGMSFDEACRAATVFALGEMIAQMGDE